MFWRVLLSRGKPLKEMKDTDWISLREEFPATGRYIYLNNAAIGPLSTRVVESAKSVHELHARRGALCFEELLEKADRAREAAASLLGASAAEIAFTGNTTTGILTAAGSIAWKEGDNIVMPSFEFPANVYPWMALQERGVEARMVEPLDGRVTAEMLISECDDRTRVVTASFVQFSNGYRMDLSVLGRFCRDNGIYFHVDGIQGVGALRIDVRKAYIDFLSCGGHKWLLAPLGTGIFYCRKELLERLSVPFKGWTGVIDHLDFLDYRLEYVKNARRFEVGALNMAGIAGLGSSIERVLEIGVDNVEKRILGLASRLASGLTARGFDLKSPMGENERSGILSFSRGDASSGDIFTKLSENGIVVSLREGNIRASSHFYNNDEDIDGIMEALG